MPSNKPIRVYSCLFARGLSEFVVLFLCFLTGSAGLLLATPGSRDLPKLFIGGGGNTGSLTGEFLEMAGSQAQLVVIPDPGGQPNPEALRKRWEGRGFQNIQILHTDDRSVALSPNFADPIKSANAVWLTGGVQQNYSRVYAETPVEEELIRLLDRGGTIGGSSAGAAIQTKAMICGGSVNPQVLRGFDLLPGAIVDQHFLKRNRFPRLIDAIRKHPDLVGYGIDEGTALVVKDGKMRVVGRSYVARIRMVNGQIQVDVFRSGEVLSMPGDEA